MWLMLELILVDTSWFIIHYLDIAEEKLFVYACRVVVWNWRN